MIPEIGSGLRPAPGHYTQVVLTEVEVLQLGQPGQSVDVGDPVPAEVEPGEAGQALQGGHRDRGQTVGHQAQCVQIPLQTIECLVRENVIVNINIMLKITPRLLMFAQMLHCYTIIHQRNS